MSVIIPGPTGRVLYGFLKECNASPLEKIVLDCGAGGETPPLALFYEHGYKPYGIDTSDEQIGAAHTFCKENSIPLTIVKGDMRDIPFHDGSMSFVYSLNTVCHLTKRDTACAIKEIERVLTGDGLVMVNFISEDDEWFGRGKKVGKGEFLQEEDWYPGVVKKGHICSYYKDDEPDIYFESFEIIRREKRILELQIEKGNRGDGWQIADICYTAKKVG